MDELQATVWREVCGWPGYRVSSNGAVESCWQRRGKSGNYVQGNTWHPLRGGKDKDGYRKVILCQRGRRRYVRVAVLVAEAFLGPRPVGMNVAHNNGVNTDDRYWNLRWATQKDNINDKKKHGTHQVGERHPHAKLTQASVLEIRRMRAAGVKLRVLAVQFGVCIATISHVVSGRNWKAT